MLSLKRNTINLGLFLALFAAVNAFAQNPTTQPAANTPSLTKIQTRVTQKKAPEKPKPKATKRLWNLQNADIRAVIDAVSNETGKNFLVDPRVQGKVSIVSSKPMGSNEIYQVFLSVLQVLGYSAVPSGNVIKIIPSTDARSLNTPIATASHPGKGDEPVVRVINTKNIPAIQLVPILRPLLPEWSTITAYQPSNSVLIAGQANNVSRIAKLVQKMDSRASSNTRVVPLQHASADKLLTVLTTLQNSIRAAGKISTVSFAADKDNNSIIINGGPSDLQTYSQLVIKLDRAGGAVANTQVFYLNYLKAKDFAPILAKIAGAEVTAAKAAGKANLPIASSNGGTSKQVTVEAEPSTNAIVINAPPGIMANLRQVIHRLDTRPKQVLVEAVIAQVDQSVLNNLGVQWGTVAETTNSNNINPITSGTSSFQQGIGIIKSQYGIRTIINALRTDSDTDILSTPSIVAVDNKQASIEVGKTVSIESGSYASTGASDQEGNVNPFNTFDRQNVSLKLTITPQISPDNSVRLDIDQKNDTLANPTNPGSQPVVNTAEIKTSVLVNSGDILVLGGLISHDTENKIERVPILGDIPLIGRLFQYHNKTIEKRNLMIFLRPVILRRNLTSTTERVAQVSEDRYNYIRQKQLQKRQGENLIPTLRATPLLPPFSKPKVEIPPPFGAGNGK